MSVRLLSFAVVAAVLLRASASAASPPPRPPNVVLIMADDAGVEAFGCYGSESCRTPVIDELAATGVRFTNCHAQPLCTPSRVKIMTGRSDVRNYVRFGVLDPRERTFGHVLRGAGYRTAVAGKWQLFGSSSNGDAAGTGTRPRDAGFDEYCLWQIDRVDSRYWNPLIERNGEILERRDEDYGPDVFCEFILDFMGRHRDEPFFVYFPMALVHAPFVPTPGSADRESRDRQQNFVDMVAHTDRIVGRIVRRLDDLDLRSRTLLVFTADNGTDRRIRCRTATGTVQGGKSRPLDTGTHVPLVVSWPGTAKPGVCDDLVDFSDVLPTLAETAGIELPAEPVLDGRSFLPQVRGETGTPRQWIYCYYNPRPSNPKFPEVRFAHNTRWKLYGDDRMYDLSSDPMETSPLDAKTPTEETTRARDVLRSAIDAFPATGERIHKP